MLRLALVFLVIAFIAAGLGLPSVAIVSAELAKIIFILFLVLFVIALIAGLVIL